MDCSQYLRITNYYIGHRDAVDKTNVGDISSFSFDERDMLPNISQI